MLYISLVVSAALLLISNGLARRARRSGAPILVLCGACLVLPFLGMCIFPAVAIQSILIGVAVMIWMTTPRRPGLFLKLSGAATLTAYTIAGGIALQTELGYARLRARYPIESMEGRLPVPRASARTIDPDRLARIEGKFSDHGGFYREIQLKRLHGSTVDSFVNSPGFGVARMIYPSESGLRIEASPVPDQPGPRFGSAWSAGERLMATEEYPLELMNEDSILDFVNARGFGYVQDRRHVAGFDPHKFRRVPETPSWKVQTLELVGLLLHDPPRVYISSQLPSMDRLNDVPTRPLNDFESAGLDSLRRGEDLFTSPGPEGLRLLGAIRSTARCLACHGGERGDLLGAFSYALRPSQPLADGDKQNRHAL